MLHSLLVCPRCRGALSVLSGTASGPPSHVKCADCGRRYPFVGGIPCLVHDPDQTLAQWGARVHAFERDNRQARDQLLAQLVGGGEVHASTRARTQSLRDALADHRSRLTALAKDAGVISAPGAALRDADGVPGEDTLTAYYHQIHRDWGWEDSEEGEDSESGETGIALAELAHVLGADPHLGNMLVLGAGACRLPWELHRRYADSTLAMDLNPVPFWVASRILSGEGVALFEFPIRPRSTRSVAVDRRLHRDVAPECASRFMFAFGDGLDPPVRPHAFDTVFTPWFIDQIPKDLTEIFATLHELLPPGGTWVNHGPLIYHPDHTAFVHRYCMDEVLAMAQAAGFHVDAYRFERLPYMVSPAGSQGRTEMVLTLRATRVANANNGDERRASTLSDTDPAWLVDPNVAIPRLPGLQDYRAPHPMFAAIAVAIDGRRTAADIGRLLADKHGVPAAAATEGVRAALSEIVRALADRSS